MSLRWPLPHEHVKKLTTDTIWTDEHPDLASLEHLRARGDDIADNVVLHWRQHRNGTIFEAFHGAFCEQGGPSAPEAYAELHSKVTTVPAWVDWDLVAQGQAVFWRYWLPITQVCCCCCLGLYVVPPDVQAITEPWSVQDVLYKVSYQIYQHRHCFTAAWWVGMVHPRSVQCSTAQGIWQGMQ